MIKKSLILLLCILLIIFFSVPNLINKNVSKVSYVYPKIKNVEKNIYCRGKVFSENKAEIYTDTPILPEMVNCYIGSEVKKGDVLVKINAEKTVNILSSESPVEKSIGNIYDLISEISNPELLYMIGKAYNINKSQVDKLIESAKYRKCENKVYYVPTEITAPFDGVITSININENILSSGNKPAIVIDSYDKLIVEAEIAQSGIDKVKLGMKAEIECNDNIIEGVVSRIYPTAEKNLSQEPIVKFLIEPLDKDYKLKSGYDVKVILKEENKEDSITLPVEAINQDENNREYVYVYKNNCPIKKHIETGIETPYYTQILKGITGDEMVLISDDRDKTLGKVLLQGEFYEKQ